jgi:preprotein translocase subunit Sss1
LVFLKVHSLVVRAVLKAALYGLAAVQVVGYLLVLLLELVR